VNKVNEYMSTIDRADSNNNNDSDSDYGSERGNLSSNKDNSANLDGYISSDNDDNLSSLKNLSEEELKTKWKKLNEEITSYSISEKVMRDFFETKELYLKQMRQLNRNIKYNEYLLKLAERGKLDINFCSEGKCNTLDEFQLYIENLIKEEVKRMDAQTLEQVKYDCENYKSLTENRVSRRTSVLNELKLREKKK